MFLSLIVVLSGQADAGLLAVRVGGVDGARSVQLMAVGSGLPQVVGCTDRGVAPDQQTDGQWTCEPVPLDEAEVRVALAVDGRLIEAGTVVLPADGEAAWSILVDGGRVTLAPSGSLLSPASDLVPAGGATLVLAEVRGDFPSGAPMLRLVSDLGTSQASCGDDGQFPDRVRNDGVLGCAGPALGDPVRVVLQVAGGEPVELGSFSDAGDLLMLSLDAAQRSAEVVALPWPWPVIGVAEADHQPGPEPEPQAPPEPHEAPPVVSPEGLNAGAQPPPVVRPQDPSQTSPSSHGGAADRQGEGLIDALMVGLSLLVGFGAAWFLPRRGPQLPAGVVRIPAPALFAGGGPGLDERAVLFRTTRPSEFTAALVARLAASRPVLAVLPGDTELASVAGAPVYVTRIRDWEEIDRQVRGLAQAGGLMPVVVVVGRDTLTAPGAVAEDPPARLAERLPAGCWLGLVAAADAPTVGFLVPWDVEHDGGWSLVRGAGSPGPG